MPKEQTLTSVKRALHDVPKDRQAAVVCALVGHSRIVTFCFGYIYCGRCDTQIADKLAGAGYDQARECVQVGHNCAICRSNYKKLTWKDKFLAPNPFKRKEKGNDDFVER